MDIRILQHFQKLLSTEGKLEGQYHCITVTFWKHQRMKSEFQHIQMMQGVQIVVDLIIISDPIDGMIIYVGIDTHLCVRDQKV